MKSTKEETFKQSEFRIQKALFRAFNSHRYKFTNLYFFKNESDWLSFTKDLYSYDIEIKISRSDFLADFKKDRHKLMEAAFQGKSSVTLRGSTQPHVCNFSYRNEYRVKRGWSDNYGEVTNKREIVGHSRISIKDCTKVGNRFFFAVPEGLVTPEEVPEYSGLIYVNEYGSAEMIKKAPLIHKVKHDVRRKFDMLYYLYENNLRRSLFTQ